MQLIVGGWLSGKSYIRSALHMALKYPSRKSPLVIKSSKRVPRNASLLLNSGVDLKVISEHLGHCDIGVTANIYADVLQKQKIRLADTIDAKLSDELN